FDDDPDAAAALDWLEGTYAGLHAQHLQEWLTDQHDWPAEWRDASGLSDALLRLSPAQLQELKDELHAVIARWHDVESGDDAERVLVVLSAFPFRRAGAGS
ncbi:MAG: hypothetical protein ACRDQF_15695, partial [Thermocrispum sp.]